MIGQTGWVTVVYESGRHSSQLTQSVTFLKQSFQRDDKLLRKCSNTIIREDVRERNKQTNRNRNLINVSFYCLCYPQITVPAISQMHDMMMLRYGSFKRVPDLVVWPRSEHDVTRVW